MSVFFLFLVSRIIYFSDIMIEMNKKINLIKRIGKLKFLLKEGIKARERKVLSNEISIIGIILIGSAFILLLSYFKSI
jgi:hypothetical protein